MACTQVLDDSTYAPVANTGKVKAGVLFINGLRHDIFSGDNVIGRDEQCDIVISSAAISTRHAVIEIEDPETHLIYDTGSTNKTRLRKIVMKPHVRYNLQNGDEIMFANIKATYTKWTETICDSDNGSETGSELEINCIDDTSFNKNRLSSKTDVETLYGSIIDETRVGNNTAVSVNKSIKSLSASDLKSGNDSTLCTSPSYLYTPVFQRVKNIGNVLHDRNKRDKTVDDTIDDISMLSVGASSNSKQLEASKVSEIPESDDEDDEDDFCILSQKTRSVQKKKIANENLAKQSVRDKSYEEDSVDFFDETNINETGNESAPEPSSVSSPLQSHTKSNVNCEELLQDFSQCDISQSLLTDCDSDILHANDKHVVNVTDNNETQVPLNKTTNDEHIKGEDETQVSNKSDTSVSSCTTIDVDETQVADKTETTDNDSCTIVDADDEVESQSVLVENAESVLNEIQDAVSCRIKVSDNIKSCNAKNIERTVSAKEANHSKTDGDNKKVISIYDLDTQRPEDLDDSINILYDAETQALVNRHKSKFGSKQSPIRSKLKELENRSHQISSLHKTSETPSKVRNLSHSCSRSLSTVHESVTENSEDDSAFEINTQLPEDFEAICSPEIQERIVTKNEDIKDNSIFDVDTQLPEEFEDVRIPHVKENIATKNRVLEGKLDKDKAHCFENQDSGIGNSFDNDTQLSFDSNKTKQSDHSELSDTFKIPSSTKRITLSSKNRETKTENRNQEASLIGENSQKSECRKGLFKDRIEKPSSDSDQERIGHVAKTLAKAKPPLEEDISDEMTQKLVMSPKYHSISTKIQDTKFVHNCDKDDISDELTQKISVTKWQTSDVSDKLIRASSNKVQFGGEVNNVAINECNEEDDMSDESTQKLPIPKLKKFVDDSDTLIKKVDNEHMVVTNKVNMIKCDEDLSDELTQKMPLTKLNKIPRTSTNVLLGRLNRNSKNNTSKCNDENMSDELKQKILIHKDKNIASISNGVVDVQSRKQEMQIVNKTEECSEDMSDELTQKIKTPKDKHASSGSSKVVESLNKNQEEESGKECDRDLSDELTQKIPIPVGKHNLSASNKLLETRSENQKERVDVIQEDLSDEMTQKFITPKSKHTLSFSSKIVESVNKNQKQQGKGGGEDLSDELTQKIVTPNGKHMPSSSNKLLERGNKTQNELVYISEEDLSDEMTQKFIIPKSKHTPSVSSKVIESISKNKKEQQRKGCDRDLSDELTQKIQTPKSKLIALNKLLETRNTNQKGQVGVIQDDLSDEMTQKIVIPDSKKVPELCDRKLETPQKEQLNIANNAMDLHDEEEDISDELTQKISIPKGKGVPCISNKLLKSVNKNQAAVVNRIVKCDEEDMSNEPTQKIVTPKGKSAPNIYSKSVKSLNKTQLDQEKKPENRKEEMPDVLRIKISIPIDKQVPSTSHQQMETVDNRQLDRRGDDECDLSDEPTQKMHKLRSKRVLDTSDNILKVQNDQAITKDVVKRDSLRQTSGEAPNQEMCVKKSKRNFNTETKTSEPKTLYVEDVKQQIAKKLDDVDLSDEPTQKLHSDESGRNASKIQKDKAKVAETSKHESVQKRSKRKQANKNEKHEIKSANVNQHETETVSNVSPQNDTKQNRKLVVSLNREEVNNKMESRGKKREEKNRTGDSYKYKNKLDSKNTDSNLSGGNKKQSKTPDVYSPLKGSNTSTEINQTFNTSHIFDDSDSDTTDLEEIFVEDEVKKFKERRITDYFKKHNSDDENRTMRHSAELKLQKRNDNCITPVKKQSDRHRVQSDSPSPFALPSLANIKKAEIDYYETLSPLKIPDHIRNIDKEVSNMPSTSQRLHRVRRNIKTKLECNKSVDPLEILDEKNSNKRVNKTKSDNLRKSNKTVQKTPGSAHAKEISANSTPQVRENTLVKGVLSENIETRSRSTSKNNSTHTAPSIKSNSTRVSKRRLEKQFLNNKLLTVKISKMETTSDTSGVNNNMNNSAQCTDKSPSSDKIQTTTKINSKERSQKDSKKVKNKRSHSHDLSTELKSKTAKLLKTEEEKKETLKSPVPDKTLAENSHVEEVGTGRRTTRQTYKGKDRDRNLNKSNELNLIEINKNMDSHTTETYLSTNDKTQRKRNLESTLSKDVTDLKVRKLANSSNAESNTGIKIIIHRNQNDSNARYSISKQDTRDSNKMMREANNSINYDIDDISSAGNNTDSTNGLQMGSGTADSYNVRQSKRILQKKMSNLTTAKSVISNEKSSRRHSPRFSGSKTLSNDSEERHNVMENPATTRIRPSTRRSHTYERILFTGMSDPKLEPIIKELGGVIAESPQDCTVLVTDKVRRTVKMLCAVARGKPIVTPDWIMKSQAAGHFLDPWQHLIVDTEAEKKYGFQLCKVLTESKQHCTLEGYSVYITLSVQQPSIPEVKTIIESCRAKVLEKVPSKWPERSFIVSCIEDKSVWKKLERKSVLPPVVITETLLSGVFHNHINLDYHRLC